MNRERITTLADTIEEHYLEHKGLAGTWGEQVGFNMNTWMGDTNPIFEGDDPLIDHVNGCGTVACIAGWSCILFGAPDAEIYENGHFNVAMDRLGLDGDIAYQLFLPTPKIVRGTDVTVRQQINSYRNSITAPQAVATLRHLLETGEVDFERHRT